jgi:hypothetical protein
LLEFPFFVRVRSNKLERRYRVKFRILPKVHGFTDTKGVTHLPGEIIDLPATYEGESWLERVDKPAKVEVSPAKVEPIVEVKSEVPLEQPKKSRKKE